MFIPDFKVPSRYQSNAAPSAPMETATLRMAKMLTTTLASNLYQSCEEQNRYKKSTKVEIWNSHFRVHRALTGSQGHYNRVDEGRQRFCTLYRIRHFKQVLI